MITSNSYGGIYPYWLLLKRILRGKSIKPITLKQPSQPSYDNKTITFVMIVSPEFDQQIPNASTIARLGWCHGFEKIGIPYRIISVLELSEYLPTIQRPLGWLTETDYRYLTDRNLRALRNIRHIVWVNPWFHGEGRYYYERGLPNLSNPKWTRQRVLESEPSFVFTISPQSSFDFYELWSKHGLKILSLPLAWDAVTYPINSSPDPEFDNVIIAFVGGYWKYKAQQLDRYLMRYASNLTVFGYSKWPYGKYGGLLPISREASLYRQAQVCPVINEPHVELMGIDQNERVFKVLGSGGFAVTDVVPGYREWFSDDELLVPQHESEFHEIVQLACRDMNLINHYRKTGQRAVIERHQYTHRAIQVLKNLNPRVESLSEIYDKGTRNDF